MLLFSPILLLGLLFGMRHALETDHVAAVSSILAGERQSGPAVRHGLTWGLGHTLALFVFAGAALVLGLVIPLVLQSRLELLVGLMLIGLGLNVLWRLHRERVHFHAHDHGDGPHLHAHGHANASTANTATAHDHDHQFRWRTLMVGIMHGMAGSGALLVLTATQIHDPWIGALYVLLFGIGSMLGMGALSLVVIWPLKAAAHVMTSANRAIQVSLALITICIGAKSTINYF